MGIEEYVKTIKEIEEREGLNEASSKVALMNISSAIDKFVKQMRKQIKKNWLTATDADDDDPNNVVYNINNDLGDIEIGIDRIEEGSINLRKAIKHL